MTPQKPKINLPFTVESLVQLLKDGASNNGKHLHSDIAEWAWAFWWECDEGSLKDIDSPRHNASAGVALDIDAQWDLHLANTYSLEQLKKMDLSTVKLPREWFDDWLKKIPNA